jgi:hypothetical protein
MEIIKINDLNCRNVYNVAHAINRHVANTIPVLKSRINADIVGPKAQVQLVPTVHTNVFERVLRTNAVTLHKPPFEQIKSIVVATFQRLEGVCTTNSDISIRHLMEPTKLLRTLHMFSKWTSACWCYSLFW